jgi:hypothetical protein
VAAGGAAYTLLLRPKLRTWGTRGDEVEAALPGDELVRGAYRTTHAVTIASPPEQVWPWLVQMGFGRAGWYSYDVLERAVGAGDFTDDGSARRIIPELQTLAAGDTVFLSAAGGPTVARLDPSRCLVLHFRMDLLTSGAARPQSRAVLDWTWSFVLEPAPTGCRLLARVRGDVSPGWMSLTFPLLETIHFAMERKMLRSIKQRAEATA